MNPPNPPPSAALEDTGQYLKTFLLVKTWGAVVGAGSCGWGPWMLLNIPTAQDAPLPQEQSSPKGHYCKREKLDTGTDGREHLGGAQLKHPISSSLLPT